MFGDGFEGFTGSLQARRYVELYGFGVEVVRVHVSHKDGVTKLMYYGPSLIGSPDERATTGGKNIVSLVFNGVVEEESVAETSARIEGWSAKMRGNGTGEASS